MRPLGADGSAVGVRVEQSITLEGLPLEDGYVMRTVTTARTASAANSTDGAEAPPIIPPAEAPTQLSIAIEGAVECNAGAGTTGLKGVIEGILYSQSREASVLFLELVASDCTVKNASRSSAPVSLASAPRPADSRFAPVLDVGADRSRMRADSDDDAVSNDPLSDDGDDASRASSEFSWCACRTPANHLLHGCISHVEHLLLLPRDSARSWMSGGQAAVASMSEGDLRERLSLVAQLKEEGLLDPEAVVCDSISFLTLFVHSRLRVRVPVRLQLTAAGTFEAVSQRWAQEERDASPISGVCTRYRGLGKRCSSRNE